MATHREHTQLQAYGLLDPGCERCQELVVGDLSDEFLESVCGYTRRQLEDEFGDSPFWDSIVGWNALRTQARYREVIRRRERAAGRI